MFGPLVGLRFYLSVVFVCVLDYVDYRGAAPFC